MSNFRIMLLSTAAIGFAGALATSASAGEVEKSASFGGHVNRVVTVVDDGDSTDVFNEDATASMSRVRFQGSAVSESLTTKAYIEVRAKGSQTSGTAATSGGNSLTMRHSYVSLSNNMGTLVVGNTNPSGDLNGVSSGNFSGSSGNGVDYDSPNPSSVTGFIAQNAGNSTGQEEGGLGTGVAPASAFTAGRGAVLRYDSPDFNGFSVSASVKNGDDPDQGGESSASVAYSADFDGTKVGFGYGYNNLAGNSTTYSKRHAVGAGFELASGINAHVGYAKKTNKASGAIDPRVWVIDLGYNMSVVDAGGTSVNVSYTDTDETVSLTDSGNWYGINVQQELSDYGTSLYGGISKAEYSVTGTNYEDITAGWVGIKVAF